MAINSPLSAASSWRHRIRWALLMLVFMALVSYLGYLLFLRADTHPLAALSAQVVHQLSEEKPQPAAVNHVAGITQTLDLTGDIDAQLTNGWKLFEYYPLAADLNARRPSQIYLVYHNYHKFQQRVDVTFGYPVQRPVESADYIQTITLNKQGYIRLEDSYVLSTWKNARALPVTLAYDRDFEIYQLNRSHKVRAKTAYISVKQG